MVTRYEKCKRRVVNNVLKSYEKKKNYNKKQAIAVAISISEKNCKKVFGKNDIKKIESKIKIICYENKIQKLNQLTIINNIKDLFEYYKKNKKYYKKMKLENKLMRLILLNKNTIKKNIISSIMKLFEL